MADGIDAIHHILPDRGVASGVRPDAADTPWVFDIVTLDRVVGYDPDDAGMLAAARHPGTSPRSG